MKKNLSVYLYIIIAIIANLIFFNLNIRLDLTRDGIYSLSKGTQNILKKIDDNLFIDLYYSKELPVQIAANKEYVNSILKDYSRYSKGKIKFSLFKVDDSPNSKKSAIEEGITPVRFDIVSKEKFEQREGFLGLSIRYREKKEVMPFISDISNFEYEISSKINMLINEKKKNIYFITDAQAISSYRLSPEIKAKLSNNYEIKDVSLAELYKTTEEITGCFIGPSSPLDEKSLFYLDQILVRGSKIFLAYDSRYTSMDSFFTRENKTGVEKILEKNGIKIKNTLITDKNSQAIQIAFRQGPFIVTNIVKYPYFIITDNLDRNNPTTRDIYSLTLPFASPIEYSTGTEKTLTPLIKTSGYSRAKKENSYININPFQDYSPSDDDLKGPFNVALIFKGKMESYLESIPKELEKDKKEKVSLIKKAEKESLLYMVSTSKFLFQENLNYENAQYFINIVNYLSQDEDLITIRPKKAGFIPLKEINDNAKTAIKYFNIFLPIIMVISFGIYRWKKTQKNIRKAVSEYKD
ncbi:MAG: GldG family protein [Elusimicrobiales bacterium]